MVGVLVNIFFLLPPTVTSILQSALAGTVIDSLNDVVSLILTL